MPQLLPQVTTTPLALARGCLSLLIVIKKVFSLLQAPSLYTIKENPLTYSLMFSEQTAPIGTYNIPMDSEFHADGCMEPKNGPRALTGFFSSTIIKDKRIVLRVH